MFKDEKGMLQIERAEVDQLVIDYVRSQGYEWQPLSYNFDHSAYHMPFTGISLTAKDMVKEQQCMMVLQNKEEVLVFVGNKAAILGIQSMYRPNEWNMTLTEIDGGKVPDVKRIQLMSNLPVYQTKMEDMFEGMTQMETRYLVIENLMGGCAWIHHDCDTEEEATTIVKDYNGRSPHDRMQVYAVTQAQLQKELEKGTIQYV